MKEWRNLNIAPMGTASFFVVAEKCLIGVAQVFRNHKKDIVDSGWECRDKIENVLLLIIDDE